MIHEGGDCQVSTHRLIQSTENNVMGGGGGNLDDNIIICSTCLGNTDMAEGKTVT